jgi:hypothetical protein
MGLFDNRDEQLQKLTQEIETLSKKIAELKGEQSGTRQIISLTDQVTALKTKIADLDIQRGKKQEEFDRREREVEHKVGLERRRQEQELAAAKREAVVSVREESLTAQQEQFKGQVSFMQERFEYEVRELRNLVSEMLKRLPEVSVEIAREGGAKK